MGLLIPVEGSQSEGAVICRDHGAGWYTAHVRSPCGEVPGCLPKEVSDTTVVEQGQEERCSGCSSAAAAPCLTCFLAANSIQNMNCRHDAPASLQSRVGWVARDRTLVTPNK